MKTARVVLGVCIVLLVLASVLTNWSHPSAVDAARAEAVGTGRPAEDLVLLGYRGTGGLFGRREIVEFQVREVQSPNLVRVELYKPAYFLGWQVVEVREEVRDGKP